MKCSRCGWSIPNPSCPVCWTPVDYELERDGFSLDKEREMQEEMDWDVRERRRIDALEYLQEIRNNSREAP